MWVGMLAAASSTSATGTVNAANERPQPGGVYNASKGARANPQTTSTRPANATSENRPR